MSSRPSASRWEAYCILCNILRRCIDIQKPVLPTDPPWDQIVQLSSHHLVTPTLAWATRDVPSVPADIREFLDAVLTLNRERNRAIEKTLVSALRAWNSEAIPSVLLKGVASLAGNLYPESGVRILSDIDVLIPVDRAEAATRLLTQNDFEPIPAESDYANHHHLAPLRHRVTGICVEIHKHALSVDCRSVLPTESAWREAQPCSVGGVATQCLTPSMQFVHVLAHTQIQDANHKRRSFALRQMLELAMLAQHHADEMNWDDIAEIFRAAGHYVVLQNAMEFIARQFGTERLPAIAAPDHDPLRSLRKRLEGRLEWPGYVIANYFAFYLRFVKDRPLNILRIFRPRRLASHINENFVRPWRASRWR